MKDTERLALTLLDKMSHAILAIDTEYNISYVNKECEDLLSIKKEDAIGRNIYEYWPDAPEDYRHVENTLKHKKEFSLDAVPLEWGSYDKYLKVQTHLMKEDNLVTGAFVEFTEVTQHIETHKKMSSRMLEMAISLIPLSDHLALLPLQPITEDIDFSYILDDSLTAVTKLRPKTLIVDLSMIEETTPMFFDIITKLQESIRLIGIEMLVSGIRPSMAKDWVHSGVMLKNRCYSSLKAALKSRMQEV
ncbi:PAS domain-containing protein [Peribacillus sp. SCS-37]|uniref:PAS domain-containing protein n=1 Tax=Paraperibacillus esterisolvens TaxID=3115296 RepID=UPI00390696BF